MATLKNKSLFFTTSPRSPIKMIPEIKLLCENFSNQKWNKQTQKIFIDILANSPFFEGKGSAREKDFSARDRINRAPKALGFVDIAPQIKLTEPGQALVFGKMPQEIFLRQLLKFQLPSPFHTESKTIKGTFFIKPYLEVLRLIRDLEHLSFDELKIFVLMLTDYRQYDMIKESILQFRKEKKENYKEFANAEWEKRLRGLYAKEIYSGKTKTRETSDSSLKKFLKTKKSNARDYTDACFRYLRYTGLVSISYKERSLLISPDKIKEVDFILSHIDRNPVFIDDINKYKNYLFDATSPTLFYDNKTNLIEHIMRIGKYTKRVLSQKGIEQLKELHYRLLEKTKETIISDQINRIKSYDLYSEIIDTYNEILTDEYYDSPLMLEYNTWRAMTMLDGGRIKGNFRLDDEGKPLSTAAGNMPDIECDYGSFMLSVEVTMQQGQRQYESESEPVARHLGNLKRQNNKDSYCLFIAPSISKACLAYFYVLNQIDVAFYCGKSKIIPLDLDQFMKLIENAYNYRSVPTHNDIQHFLDEIINKIRDVKNENEWKNLIQTTVCQWLSHNK